MVANLGRFGHGNVANDLMGWPVVLGYLYGRLYDGSYGVALNGRLYGVALDRRLFVGSLVWSLSIGELARYLIPFYC